MNTTVTLRLRTIVADLQRELGVTMDCGQLTLNFNQGLCASLDVHHHARMTPMDERAPLTGRKPERSFA